MTVDDVLFAPSPASTSERGYVALSRGRHSNRIYAVKDTAWEQALSESRTHTFATQQQPTDRRMLDEHARLEALRAQRAARDVRRDRQPKRDDGLSMSM
ncbi:MAG: hypothetical protein ACRDZO_25120 [Egibacteraceae bacterium]